MIRNYSVKPKGSLKRGTNVDNFELLRTREQAPIIITNPIDATIQTKYRFPDGSLQPVTPLNGTVYLLKGTPFSIAVGALDPSNVTDITNTSELTYHWKLNDNSIYSANNQNRGKGTTTLQYRASQATVDLNGILTCEVTNEYGTTVTPAMTIQIVDPETTPLYYENLIANGSGEAGTDGWVVSDQIQTSDFINGILECDNFASIEPAIGGESDPTMYEQKLNTRLPFKFCRESNWANFNRFITDPDFPQAYGWWWRYKKPNLIQNEHPWDPFASFFPSLQYVDEFNANEGKYGLKATFGVVGSYFGRKELAFQKDGEPTTATMTQTIDLNNYQAQIDGYVNGIDTTPGRFFCYVGVGLDKYEYKLYVGGTNEYTPEAIVPGAGEIIPENPQLWQEIYQELPGVWSLLGPDARINATNDIYLNAGGTFIPNVIAATNEELKQYNTFILSAADLIRLANGEIYNKINFTTVTRIDIIPKIHNRANIEVQAVLENGSTQSLVNLNGPGELELMAVKERVLLSYMVNRTIGKAATLNTVNKVPVYLLDTKLCEIGPGSRRYNEDYITEQLGSYPNEFYGLDSNTVPDKEIGSDRGVQAFFAIGANFNVPKLTRSLKVVVNMQHSSRAYNNQAPETGIVSWQESMLYAEHAGSVDANGAFYKASTPKIAVTQMKLTLYDNGYSRGPLHANYFIPPSNILNENLKFLQKRGFDDSQAPSYVFIGKPNSFTYPVTETSAERVSIQMISSSVGPIS
jgi:hypothetical protein